MDDIIDEPFRVKAGETVVSRDGKLEGVTTGSFRRCKLEGCNGMKIGVRWPRVNGKVQTTFPCTKGMSGGDDWWKII